MYQRSYRIWRPCFKIWRIKAAYYATMKRKWNRLTMAKTNFFSSVDQFNKNGAFDLSGLVRWPLQIVFDTDGSPPIWEQALVTGESTLLFRYNKNLEVPKFLSFPHKTCPLTPFMGQTSTLPSICGREKRRKDDRSFIALLSIFGEIEESRFHMFSCLGCFEHREK